MSAAMLGARLSTTLLTPLRLHGALSEHALPAPDGEAYSTVAVAADAGIGARVSAHASALSAPRARMDDGRNSAIDTPLPKGAGGRSALRPDGCDRCPGTLSSGDSLTADRRRWRRGWRGLKP